MASVTSQTDPEHRIRSTALRHALEIEERKKLQTRIADLVVDAFDLPSNPDADPAHPLASDAALFKQCLGLFQASDLDVLIYERNVDNRCGYALCPKANEKLSHDGQLVWNKKAGKDFKLVDKSELEQWCSTLCQERTVFVRAQLGKEPAWLREVKQVDIKLLDEVGTLDLADSFRALSLGKAAEEEMAERLQALAIERGNPQVMNDTNRISLIEKSTDTVPPAPSLKQSQQNTVEGHQPRKALVSNSQNRSYT